TRTLSRWSRSSSYPPPLRILPLSQSTRASRACSCLQRGQRAQPVPGQGRASSLAQRKKAAVRTRQAPRTFSPAGGVGVLWSSSGESSPFSTAPKLVAVARRATAWPRRGEGATVGVFLGRRSPGMSLGRRRRGGFSVAGRAAPPLQRDEPTV